MKMLEFSVPLKFSWRWKTVCFVAYSKENIRRCNRLNIKIDSYCIIYDDKFFRFIFLSCFFFLNIDIFGLVTFYLNV